MNEQELKSKLQEAEKELSDLHAFVSDVEEALYCGSPTVSADETEADQRTRIVEDTRALRIGWEENNHKLGEIVLFKSKLARPSWFFCAKKTVIEALDRALGLKK